LADAFSCSACPSRLLDQEQTVQVLAKRQVIGAEIGRQRRRRVGRHIGRAEQGAHRQPLPDEPPDVGQLGGRIARVQPH
jgi:hypothetical protein